jgi:sigma 54 modulation/S30EA-like ribosomal protein
LTVGQAVERLDATELPYRFFRDAGTHRGAVLYRRYDGHYGLITPAESSVESRSSADQRYRRGR